MKANYTNTDYAKHYFKHIKLVIYAWIGIRDRLLELNMINEEEYNKINMLIAWHDNSKMDDEEWVPYSERFNGKNQDDPEVKASFKEAVKLHKMKNLHHFESLRDYEGPDWKCYICEMVCDYIAMGWEFDNYILEYYDKAKDEIDLPEQYKSFLESILNLIRTDNELSFAEEAMTDEKMNSLYSKI